MDFTRLTIQDAAAGIRERKFSVTELVSNCMETIKIRDPEVHAYIEVFDDAMRQAKSADLELSSRPASDRKNLPPLFGIPIALKDNILFKGKRCTAGSKILENYTASYSATVVEKLQAQGAIIMGKTNLDEFAMGSSTEHSAFGPTRNPWDARRVPGGSSGGSAAAIAAGMALAALGSDTGGSIRQPAAFCGVVGMKPTYGTVSRHGLIAMASSLDQIGPMAKTVEEAKILFQAIAGGDEFDATATKSTDHELRIRDQSLKDIKIGVPKEYFGAGLDPEVAEIIKGAIKKAEVAGARIEEITLPHSEYALPAYYIIVPSEVSANLARFDGIRYGGCATTNYQLSTINLYDMYAHTRSVGFGAEVKRRIMLGTYALSAGYYDAYYLKAQKVRRLIRDDFARAFESVDVILGPTTPTPAFLLGEHSADPLEMYIADIYTVAVNLAGLPALSLPAGKILRNEAALPVGLQLIAPWSADLKLFAIAYNMETILSYAS